MKQRPFSVATAVDEYVEKLEEEREPDGYWHPSSLFGCARRAIYDFLGTPKAPLDARAKRVFRMGHIFHKFIQEAIQDSREIKTVYVEVKIEDPDRRIKGHADVLIETHDGVWVVIELKSIKSAGMKYGDLPKDDHRKQVSTYVSVLRRHGGIIEDEDGNEIGRIPPLGELSQVIFAYVSKDDLEIKEFYQVHTEQKEEWIDSYLADLERHVRDGTLPKRLVRLTPKGQPSKQKHYLCSYCPFFEQCWNVDPEGVD